MRKYNTYLITRVTKDKYRYIETIKTEAINRKSLLENFNFDAYAILNIIDVEVNDDNNSNKKQSDK